MFRTLIRSLRPSPNTIPFTSNASRGSLAFVTRSCRYVAWVGGMILLPASSVCAQTQPPTVDSTRPSIRWDDGSVRLGDGHDHAGHDHAGHSHALGEETREERALKAKMTPEQRAEFDRKKAEAKSREAQARELRFAFIPDEDTSEEAKAYRAAYAEFQKAVTELIMAMNRHSLAYEINEAKQKELDDLWNSSLSNCHKARRIWIEQCAKTYLANPQKYASLGLSLKEMFLFDAQLDRVDVWKTSLSAMLELDPNLLDGELLLELVSACIANQEYDLAMAAGELLKQKHELVESQLLFLSNLPRMKEVWEKEKAKRQEESQRDNNPRIELATSKGRVVIELFEDDAPEAVANIIYLTERGYYNRKAFFRVEQHMVAQTGCEKGDGTGDAGYTIRGEVTSESYRPHLRGSCAIALGAKDGGPDSDSGSSQFYIAFTTLEHLDGKYTVFGRVIEGMENVSLFRQMNLADEEESKEQKNPDFIIETKVLRKRDHEYKPTPVRGKLFR
ncbi:peptidylprolyl isomerase [Pirellulaceae bacterium SH467]